MAYIDLFGNEKRFQKIILSFLFIYSILIKYHQII